MSDIKEIDISNQLINISDSNNYDQENIFKFKNMNFKDKSGFPCKLKALVTTCVNKFVIAPIFPLCFDTNSLTRPSI